MLISTALASSLDQVRRLEPPHLRLVGLAENWALTGATAARMLAKPVFSRGMLFRSARRSSSSRCQRSEGMVCSPEPVAMVWRSSTRWLASTSTVVV